MFRRAALALVAVALIAASPPPPDPASTHADALQGLTAVAHRAAVVDRLGAFGSDGLQQLRQALGSLPLVTATDRAGQLAELDSAVQQTEHWAGVLSADGVQPGLEEPQAMGALSSSDRAAAAAGRPISASPGVYLYVLDDLLNRNGRPPLPSRQAAAAPDPSAINAALARLVAQPSPRPPSPVAPSPAAPVHTAQPVTDTHQAAFLEPAEVAGGAVLVLLLLLLALLLWRRRRPAAPAPLEDLLEVSRRLAGARTPEDAYRAAVRESLNLVPATAGALVVRGARGLELAFEGKEPVLVPEHLAEGLIGRVADTGQPLVQVSATEPAVRNLPAAIAAVPLVGGGAVIAVLVLLRPQEQPFTMAERSLLVALAPVAAAAIASATHAGAAVEQSLQDALTGLGNRRRLETELPELLARTAGGATSLVMLDIDHFKSINDTHGHAAGDEVLRAVATLVKRRLRPEASAYRYGGEEFCFSLAGAPLEEAIAFAEQVRTAIEGTPIAIPGGGRLDVTVSLGAAEARSDDSSDLLGRADAALYAAKRGGRNQVQADKSI